MSDNDSTIVLNLGVGGDTTDASNVAAPTQADPSPTAIKRERVVIGGDSAPGGSDARAQLLDLLQKNNVYVLPTSDFTLLSELVPVLHQIRDYMRELVRLAGGLT